MSEITIDEGDFRFAFASDASIEVATPLRRYLDQPIPARQRTNVELWAFDEDAERARFDRIQLRLIRLEAALFEEFGARLNSDSKAGLLCLFVGYPAAAVPLISTEPNGVLTATWRAGQGSELAIKCVSRNKLHYSMVNTSAVNPRQVDRQWGTFHNAALFFAENAVARRIAS